ncbi:hypothetical protein CCZ01_09760 [Helicobacter monodelphidis]|nr:hypothetical protein CCZ01_09760 [Helicobacter sp. 15-1451]
MKKNLFLFGVAMATIAVMAGCEKEFEVKSKEYYSQNIEEAKKRADYCHNMGLTNGFSDKPEQRDCTNASWALDHRPMQK